MNIWMLIAAIAGLVQVAGLLVLAGSAFWAPEGYEDADGFHLGVPPLPQPGRPTDLTVGSDDLKHAA